MPSDLLGKNPRKINIPDHFHVLRFQSGRGQVAKFWEENDTFNTDDESDKEKFYCLAQFPYPSGDGLHIGHVSVYTYTDIIARYQRHLGKEVLHPMGWDAFGLPTENHAIKVGIHPTVITEKNCNTFRRQLKALGLSYDWKREINTSTPEYYRWTQWIWKQLHKAGLTYKTETAVNWCDTCKVVVANEEVEGDGMHERCSNPTRQIQRAQWMFKITEYAQKLLDGLEELDWPASSKKAQSDWIGRSQGAQVFFGLEDRDEKLEVYTTRPDTLFGATYMVLAPEHELVAAITTAEQKDEVEAYQKEAAAKNEFTRTELNAGKTGVFTGAYAINPVNEERVPIWIADYVLAGYGTGAIMAVPAHDDRDFEFAKTFDLPIIQVLTLPGESAGVELEEAFTGDGSHINSSHGDLDINGLNKIDAIDNVIAWLSDRGLGKSSVNYKLRDWIFARQRYWGEPFPLQYLDSGEIELLEDDELPITLPEVESYLPTDTGESPIANIDDWVKVKNKSGAPVKRETDTMPNWAGSCWYYLRFMDPLNTKEFASKDRQKRWGRVDVYVGGTEHLNLHDLYSRFWHKALYDMDLVAEKEPFQKLLHQGMVLGSDGSKMSKSLGNVVNPDEIIEKHGCDVLRLNLCFMGPVEANKPWSEKGLDAMRRFLNRVERLVEEKDAWIDGDGNTLSALHKTIKAVTTDFERFQFNTAIARMMELLNALQKEEKRSKAAIEALVLMLSPIAPHFAEAMWEELGHASSVTRESFPKFDEALCVDESVEIVVQFKGKIKVRAQVQAGISADEQQELILAREDVQEMMEGKTPKKVISIPGRLVNIIL